MRIDLDITLEDLAGRIANFENLPFKYRSSFMQFLINCIQDEINAQKESLLDSVMESDNYKIAYNVIADGLESIEQESEDDE